jgi:hypothetical protein
MKRRREAHDDPENGPTIMWKFALSHLHGAIRFGLARDRDRKNGDQFARVVLGSSLVSHVAT